MARLHDAPVKTYSVGFDTGFSEAAHAARVARGAAFEHVAQRQAGAAVGRGDGALDDRDVAAGDSQEVVALRYGLTRQGVKKVLWSMRGRAEVAEKYGLAQPKYLGELEGSAC